MINSYYGGIYMETNEKTYDFISNITMGKKEYTDFHNASYSRLSLVFLVLFILNMMHKNFIYI